MATTITENDAAAEYLESLPIASWAHQPYYDPFATHIASSSIPEQPSGNDNEVTVHETMPADLYDSESSNDTLSAPPTYDDGYDDYELPSGGAVAKKVGGQGGNEAEKPKPKPKEKEQARKVRGSRVTNTEDTKKPREKPKSTTTNTAAPKAAAKSTNKFSKLKDPFKYAEPAPGGKANLKRWQMKNTSADCTISRVAGLWREKANALRMAGYARVLAMQRWQHGLDAEAENTGEKSFTQAEKKAKKAADKAELGDMEDWLATLTEPYTWDEEDSRNSRERSTRERQSAQRRISRRERKMLRWERMLRIWIPLRRMRR